jgi:hypothetical protein
MLVALLRRHAVPTLVQGATRRKLELSIAPPTVAAYQTEVLVAMPLLPNAEERVLKRAQLLPLASGIR